MQGPDNEWEVFDEVEGFDYKPVETIWDKAHKRIAAIEEALNCDEAPMTYPAVRMPLEAELTVLRLLADLNSRIPT